MGNPDFAVPSLNEIMVSEHEVVAVVTSPDKPRGRGKSVSPTMVAQRASDYALPLIQPSLLKDDFFISRKLYPNVDFYSGIMYRALGIPTKMYTVMFALGRLPGWISQWKEMRTTENPRIYRPRQIYTGATKRDFIPIEKR